MKVESVLAPFMGYLGAKQEGNPQLAQSRLSEMTKALDSLRQVQQVKLERARLPSDLQYQQAMGEQAIGYGKLKTAEAEQISRSNIKADELEKFLAEAKLTTPEQSKAMVEAYKAKIARDEYEASQQAGTIPAQQYQKTQEALYAGKTAETQLAEGVPLISAQAKGAEGRATIETAIPSAREGLLTDTAKRQTEEIEAKNKQAMIDADIFNKRKPSSSGLGDMMTAYQTEGMLDRIQGRLGQFDSLKARLLDQRKKVAMGNMDSNVLASLGVNLMQSENEDPKIAQKEALTAIDQLIQDVNNNIKNTEKQYNRLSGIPEEPPKAEPVKPFATFSKSRWDSFTPENKAQWIKMYGNDNIKLIPDKKAGKATPTGNKIESKQETTPTNKKTEKKYSEMSTDELYKGVGNSTKMK